MIFAQPMRLVRLLSCCFACWLCSSAIAQKRNHWLAATLVVEWRATPLYAKDIRGAVTRQSGAIFSQDAQLTGTAVGLDVRKNIYRHRIEGSYGARFRYDHLFFETNATSGSQKSISAWTSDHLFSIIGRIPMGKSREVRIALGLGLMNRGSDYLFSEVDTLSNGQLLVYSETRNFQYSSNFVSVGYNVNGLEIGFVGYYSGEADSFEIVSPFWLPTLFLKYDLWR